MMFFLIDGRKTKEKFQLMICHLNLGWIVYIHPKERFVPFYNF